ncbi:MAG: hypothetical protein HUJ80_09775 [Firmicutes bacterium]|nr:hypothetical protein [Bacillota bacterium]
MGIHPEYWPEIRKAKSVKTEITGIGGTLEDKAISVTLSINERPRTGLFGATTYQIWKDNEGNPDFFRIIAGFNGESYTEEFYVAPSFRHWD